jgi:hypothetical protein
MLKKLNHKRAWEQRAREQHRCRTCGKPSVGLRCPGCLEKQRLSSEERRQKRQAAGLCMLCGKKVEAGYKYCNRNECYPSRRIRQ